MAPVALLILLLLSEMICWYFMHGYIYTSRSKQRKIQNVVYVFKRAVEYLMEDDEHTNL